MYASRRALEISAEFARQDGMRFRFTYIPATFAYGGSLDFKFSNTNSLFNYGMRCAVAGDIWTTPLHAIEQGQRAARTPPVRSTACPGGPVGAAPGIGTAGEGLVVSDRR